jgi:valyl-tRNA synthetase
METRYNPAEVEERWHTSWNEDKDFAPGNNGGDPYTIVIPPPNVTGALHLGHALNNTIQDILIRYRRKTGRNTLWIPGTDHAGIATQAVVEKRLFEDEGKTRRDLGRDALVQKIWDWKEEYEARITGQLKKLGSSCDWDRQRFTLDPVCARAVRHTFFNLFRKGLIYRGKRLVNWDAHLQTAVADDEIFYETKKGHMWYFQYQLADGSASLPVATTRPETILGDTAVAVHPEDPRYKDYIGKMVKVPFVNREIPVIADGMLVDPEFGTGVVKVTPAHDPNDYMTGLRHKLPMINIMTDDGFVNDNAGPFKGQSMKECRASVIKGLEEMGLMDKVEDHEHQVGHSDRSKTAIEPYLSDQWFVKMDDLAERAMEAVRSGEIKIHPERYAKSYLDWLGEKRDWCISRQLWWGHQIPIWRCDTCSEDELQQAFGDREDISWNAGNKSGEWLICAQETDLEENSLPGHKLERDPDVLDTWFSSALWPHSTLGWPEKNETLDTFYPTSVLVTSRDIITLWVARMVIFGQENMGKIPFSDVYIHTKILDGEGRTMSKSLGNGVDPLDIIEKYGTDALRFVMTHLATDNQDARLPVKAEKQEDGRVINTSERFELGRNFANKLWNACRFVEPHIAVLKSHEDMELKEELLALEDRWILSRVNSVAKRITEDLEAFRFSDVTKTLYSFIWDDLCSRYLEIKKHDITSDEVNAKKKHAVSVFVQVLYKTLNLLHPVMPFITEELNETLFPNHGKMIQAPWPASEDKWIDSEVEEAFEHIFTSVEAVRSIRGRYSVSPSKELTAVALTDSESFHKSMNANTEMVMALAKLGNFKVGTSAEPHLKPSFSAAVIIPGGEIFIALEGILDRDAEIDRLQKELDKAQKFMSSLEKKLSNERFVNNAPAQVVENEKKKLQTQKEVVEKCEAALAELK